MTDAGPPPPLDYAQPTRASFRKRMNVVLALIGAGVCGLLTLVFLVGTFLNLIALSHARTDAAIVCGGIAAFFAALTGLFIWQAAVYSRPNTPL